jgi:outer membrane protein TolC
VSRRSPSAVAAIFAAISLAGGTGCAHYEPLKLDPAESATALESRSLASPELRSYLETALGHALGQWPLPSWDLQTLTLAAFFFSPDLDVARAQWARAEAGRVTAAARPNPKLVFTPERAEHLMGNPSPWVATVALDIPIETAGKRGYRIEQAHALSQAARLAIGSAAWRVRSRLRDALLEREAAIEKSGLLSERVALQRSVADLFQKRVEAGAASRIESDPARLARERAVIEEAQGKVAITSASAAAAAAIGIPLDALDDAPVSVSLDAPPGSNLSAKQARRRAMLERGDVRAALAAFVASESTLRLEIARQYPDVHLTNQYSYDQADEKWSIGFTIDLPIFDQNQGPILEAKAARKQMLAEFDAAQQGALSDVDSAWANAQAARDGVQAAQRAAESARSVLDRVTLAVDAGAIDRVEAGAARIDALDAGIARIDARLAQARAYGALEDAMQLPFGVDLESDPVRIAASAGAVAAAAPAGAR